MKLKNDLAKQQLSSLQDLDVSIIQKWIECLISPYKYQMYTNYLYYL